MMMPEKKPAEPMLGRRQGAESLQVFEAAQQAILETRRLLDEMNNHQVFMGGRRE